MESQVEMFEGHVIVGTTVSLISRIKEQLAVLPPASVTVIVKSFDPGLRIVPAIGV